MDIFPLVSVIVPFYNTGEAIEACLRSIMQQSYSSLEVILVDDGSTDRTIDIARVFAEKDRRFRIVRQTNGGQNAARWRGLSEAKGKYVFFSDSDDTLNENAIISLVEVAEAEDCDMVVANIMDVYPDSGLQNTSVWFTEHDASSKKNIILSFLYKMGNGSLCAKLFRRDKFGFDNIWLDRNIKANEDYLVYVQNVIRHFDRFAFSSYVGYNYIHRHGTMSSLRGIEFVRDTLRVSYFLHCLIYGRFPEDERIGEALSYSAYKRMYFAMSRNKNIMLVDSQRLDILYAIAENNRQKVYDKLTRKEKFYLRIFKSNRLVRRVFCSIMQMKNRLDGIH